MLARILLLAILLAGCSAQSIPTLQGNIPVAVPKAQPMTLNVVEWQVMTAEQLKALAAKMQAEHDAVVFVLEQGSYNNLSLNLVELERYIREQKAILDMLSKIISERSQSSQGNP